MNPNTAVLFSLLDETAPDHASLPEIANDRALEYIAVPHHSRSKTKARSVQPFVATMEEGHEELVEELWADIQREGETSFKAIVKGMLNRGPKK